jgi:cell division protein ZapA
MKNAPKEDRLVSRVAFLNAENDRLKRVILDYEERFTRTIASQRSSPTYQDFSEDSQLEALGLSKSSRPRRKEEEGKLQTTNATIVALEERIEQLSLDNKRLAMENMQFKNKQSHLQEKENQRFSSESQQFENSANLHKQLYKEIEGLRETIASLKAQNKKLISEERHFEKLKEQEVFLLGTLGFSEKSTSNEAQLLRQYESKIMKLTLENKQLNQALKDRQNHRPLKELSVSHYNSQSPESEAKRHMQGLERKINDLIQENESLLQENQELKDLSLSIINSTRRSNCHLNPIAPATGSTRKASDQFRSVKEDSPSSRDKDLVDIIQLVEQKFTKETNHLKNKIADLEEELQRSRDLESQDSMCKAERLSNPQDSAELEEANCIITRLEKENRLLMTRISQLEAATSVNQEETDKLYAIIENKNKVTSDLLRDLGLSSSREGLIDIGGQT